MDHETYRWQERVEAKLDSVLAALAGIAREELKMSQELDSLATQVKNNTDAEQSAIHLLTNLAAIIEASKTDPAKLTALAGDLRSSAEKLAAAVVQNTPHAPGPTPPTPPAP